MANHMTAFLFVYENTICSLQYAHGLGMDYTQATKP